MTNVKEMLIRMQERSYIHAPACIIIIAGAGVTAKKLVQERCSHALYDHYYTNLQLDKY